MTKSGISQSSANVSLPRQRCFIGTDSILLHIVNQQRLVREIKIFKLQFNILVIMVFRGAHVVVEGGSVPLVSVTMLLNIMVKLVSLLLSHKYQLHLLNILIFKNGVLWVCLSLLIDASICSFVIYNIGVVIIILSCNSFLC